MLSYIGSKSRIGKSLIIPNIPNDIEVYVEVMGGMFWNYFMMDLDKYPNLNKIVYNDKNPLNVNLMKCVKNTEDFLEVINHTDFLIEDKDTFNHYKEQLFETEYEFGDKPDYPRGFMYAYILSTSFSGCHPKKSNCVKNGGNVNKDGIYVSKFETFIKKLNNPKWVDKFKSIDFIHDLDFNDVIDLYDDENTYLYLDPPYFNFEKYYSNHDFGYDDHKRLIDKIKGCKSRWSLSYYDFPQLEEWLPKNEYIWLSKDFTKGSGARKGKNQNKATELLITNYE